MYLKNFFLDYVYFLFATCALFKQSQLLIKYSALVVDKFNVCRFSLHSVIVLTLSIFSKPKRTTMVILVSTNACMFCFFPSLAS